MKLARFKVARYRNVFDSGWIDVDTITAFVGQNEAGKSNLFDALYRLNPFVPDETYNIDEDWPVDAEACGLGGDHVWRLHHHGYQVDALFLQRCLDLGNLCKASITANAHREIQEGVPVGEGGIEGHLGAGGGGELKVGGRASDLAGV